MARKKVDPNQLAAQLRTEGGFSVSPTGQAPTSGYMVSKYGHEQTIPGHASPLQISQFREQQPAGTYTGGWFDEQAGETALDASVRRSDKTKAVKYGEAEAQKAIYDLNKDREIRVFSPPTRRGTLFSYMRRQDYRHYVAQEQAEGQRRAATKRARRAK